MLYKMQKAFTLIELLVVLMIVSMIVAVIAPKGYKLLNSFNTKIKTYEKKQKFKLKRYQAFLTEKEIIENNITINKFGIIQNDNHKK